MSQLALIDAKCRVQQAQAVLNTWLEVATATNGDVTLIGAVMSLLEGVPKAIDVAETELGAFVMRDHQEGKS